jgi:hypothetical protein
MYFKISENHALARFQELHSLKPDFIEKYKAYKKDISPETVAPFPFAKEICRQFSALGSRNYILTHRGASTFGTPSISFFPLSII